MTQYMLYAGIFVGGTVIAALPFVDTLSTPLPPNKLGRMENKLVAGNMLCAVVIVYMAATIIASQTTEGIKVEGRLPPLLCTDRAPRTR